MRQKDVISAIHALGLTARKRDGEWRVSFRDGSPAFREATAYYTADDQDAIETARLMAAEK